MLLLIDTAGCDFEEEADAESDSKRNEGEAKAALAHAGRLVEAGLPPEAVGIITPYCAQVALLRDMRSTFARGILENVEARVRGLLSACLGANSRCGLNRDLERMTSCTHGRDWPQVSTVDGFQGREKEAIVISMVRVCRTAPANRANDASGPRTPPLKVVSFLHFMPPRRRSGATRSGRLGSSRMRGA